MPLDLEKSVIVGRDLVRVSRDRTGRGKSPDEQHTDHRRSAERNGWELRGPSYRDVGSASKFATKAREDFQRLLADLEHDRFDADVLML